MFKEKFYTQTLSEALGKIALSLPLTPMGITYLTLMVSGVGFFFASRQKPLLAASFFLVGCLFDTLDGGLARLIGMQSKLGAFVDGVLDRVVDFLLIYAFTFFPLPSVLIPFDHMITILAYSTLMPVFIVAYANHRRAVDDPQEKKVWRIMNRGELIPLLLIALASIPYSPRTVSWILMVTLFLNVITIFQSIIVAVVKSPERSMAGKIFRTKS